MDTEKAMKSDDRKNAGRFCCGRYENVILQALHYTYLSFPRHRLEGRPNRKSELSVATVKDNYIEQPAR